MELFFFLSALVSLCIDASSLVAGLTGTQYLHLLKIWTVLDFCFVLFLCSDYNLDCMPPHGYIHVLSLTDNIAEFRNAVNKQKISGNIDTPEGGFDAMLQAAVCQVKYLFKTKKRINLRYDF